MCRGVLVNEVEVVKKEAMEENLHVFPDLLEPDDVATPQFNWEDFDTFNFAAMAHVYDVARQDHQAIDQLREAIRNQDHEMTYLIMEDLLDVIEECAEKYGF
ncbi:hypothetical protein DMENIID0001_155370 [Sergentomyia squamirostris]